MARPDPAPAEPTPLADMESFSEGDFHSLSEGLSGDPQYNDRRLMARRKLAAVGKAGAAAIRKSGGPGLEVRSSLHHPHAFNRKRVRRLWAYLCRDKASKRRLRGVLGADLARDLDAAYRNAYLCCALESEALEVSLRIHPDAWYDGQNLKNRAKREGLDGWLAELRRLDGYRLRLDDWKGEWLCGPDLGRERLEEFLKFWVPGEHGLVVERRWPAPPGSGRAPALAAEVPGILVEELVRLAPLFRFTAWSKESDFLFSG